MNSLRLEEARARAAALQISSYDVTLDLAADTRTFASRTRIDLTSSDTATFLDLKPVTLHAISLDGEPLDPGHLDEGRFPLELGAGEHTVVVEATMPFRNDGEGLHRSTDPSDGRDYVYGMMFMDAAPTVFACFDQPDLKAPYTLHVTAPEDWVVTGNAPAEQVGAGRWELEQSQPLSTYFVTVVAGPYHVVEDHHDGIPLRLLCRQSLAEALDADAAELFATTKASFDAFHEMFGIRYPFGKYDQCFVPEFNAGAMENPGCVTFRDVHVFASTPTREQRILRATTLCHEMAHQWFGNIVTPQWWDDLWLNESFAEYAGNTVAAVASPYGDALAWSVLKRRSWGMDADSRPSTHPVAGNGATDALAALQDFDGISYAKGSALLGQLAARLGPEVFLGGVREHIQSHWFANATMHDLFASWEGAGAGDLGPWAEAWLRRPGTDRVTLDRDHRRLWLTPPADRPADRSHRMQLAQWDGSGWRRRTVTVSGDGADLGADLDPGEAPVLLNSDSVDWVDCTFDETTLAALPELLGQVTEPDLRAAVWTTLHNGVHQGTLDPAAAVELISAGLPTERLEVAVTVLGLSEITAGGVPPIRCLLPKLLATVPDRAAATARLHQAFIACGQTAPAGSPLRLAAFQGAVATASSAEGLHQALGGALPPGIELDDDLRWRLVKQLTALGATDRDFLDDQLARRRDAASVNAWSWCRAALPDVEAKEWAWARFTGDVPANAYELEAIGVGMWRPGQEELLEPYVERYFAGVAATASARSGWALASSAEFFYPLLFARQQTVTASDEVLSGDLDPGLRRRLADCADEVRRRVRTRERYS